MGKSMIKGTVIGGVAGGVLGNQIGKGTGKTLATVGGAAVGGVCRKPGAEKHAEERRCHNDETQLQDGL